MSRLHSQLRRSRFLSAVACLTLLQSLVGPLAAAAQDAGSSARAPASGASPFVAPYDASSGGMQPLLGANDINASVAAPGGLASLDPSTGAARSTLTFSLAGARGRVQPRLSLVYDSNAGDREAGVGWGLSLPTIERRSPSGTVDPAYVDPDDGQPIDPAHQDRFVFDGQPLVPICFIGSSGICPERDDLVMPAFARGGGWHYYSLLVENGDTLRFFWSPDHKTWVVQDKSGNTSEYGVPLDGQYDTTNGVDSESELPIYHAGHPSMVFRWKLVRQYDANRFPGTTVPTNRIVYTWNADGTLGDIYDTPELTPAPALSAYAHHVHLSYEPYPYPRATNTPVRSRTPAALLSGVDVTSADMTGVGAASRAQVRRYHLAYETLRHHSLLTKFQLEGRCGDPAREDSKGLLPATACPLLPPTQLSYMDGAPDYSVSGFDFQGIGAGKPLQKSVTFSIDINGDSLPDFVSVPPANPPGEPPNPQTLLLNTGHDSLAQQDLVPPSTSLPATLGITPANAWPGSTYNTIHVLAPHAASITPGLRAYAGDLTGDGNVNLLWVSSRPAVPRPCAPPAQERWPSVLFEYVPPASPQAYNDRWTLALAPNQVPIGAYDVSSDSQFDWIGGGDINGDGYPDRVSDLMTMSPGNLTPGECYDNNGRETLDTYVSGVEFTRKNQDGTIDPFGYSPVQSGSQIPYTGPTAGLCTEQFPPWFKASGAVLAQSLAYEQAIAEGKDAKPPVNAPFWLVDMDGDGLEDMVLFQNESFVYYPGHGDGFFGTGVCSPGAGCDCTQGQPVTMAMPARMVPSALVATAEKAGIPYALHDVNGDGLADLVFSNPDSAQPSIYVYENLDGTTFGDANAIQVPASVADYDPTTTKVLFADTDGTGVDKILLVTDSAIHYFDLFAGQRPMLLWTIDNGLGATTTLEYSTTAKLIASSSFARSQTPRSMNVVTAVETKDGAIDTRTEYHYGEPVYDVREHAFRGFRVVEKVVTGDSAVPARGTITRYAIGQCAQLPCYGVDQPYEAVRALPTTVYTPGLSLRHTQYSFQQRMQGLDGRNVYIVYPEQLDTYLWPSPSTPNTSLTVTDLDSTVPSVQLTSMIPIPGRAGPHLRVTRGLWGPGNNETWRIDWGRVDINADRLIGQTTNWQLEGDPGNWVWRPQETKLSYVNPPSMPGGITPSGPVRDLTYGYDTAGNLLDVYGVLSGTLPLQRSHEDPSAKFASGPGPNASIDGMVHLQHRALDPNGDGNVLLVQAPDNQCVRYAYDQAFAQLPVQRIVYAGPVGPQGCGTDPLATTFNYDRGFARVIQTVDPNGATSTASYDGFGRLVQATDSDPSSPLPNALPTFLAEYDVKTGSPMRVHTQQLVGEGKPFSLLPKLPPKGPRGIYRERWDFIDGLGRHLATLSSADPTAGDTANWIVSGRTQVSANGYVLKAYQPAWYPGAPLSFNPEAAPNPAPYAQSYSYDQFGRLSETFALDGTPASKIERSALQVVLADADDLDLSSPHFNTPTTIRYDGHGRIVETDEISEVQSQAVTVVNQWTYEATGEIDTLQRTAPGSAAYIHAATYDTLGRMIENHEPNALKWSFNGLSAQGWRYAYDDAGQLVGTSDPRGCGENFYYDAAGRVAGEDYSPCRSSQPVYSTPTLASGLPSGDGAEVLYVYDQDQAGDTAASAGRGRLTAVLDRAAHTRIHYDMRGRVIDTQRRLALPTGASISAVADRYTQHWFDQATAYDEASEVVAQSTGADVPELLDSAGRSVITASYSLRGLLAAAGGSYGSLIDSASYDADTLPITIDYAGGAVKATFWYDTLRRLQRKTVTGSSTPSLLEDSVFTYDRVGNPTEIDDDRNPSDWPEGAQPSSRKSIGYDHAYRLLNIGYWAGADKFHPPNTGLPNALPDAQTTYRVAAQSFVYDALGNTTQTNDDADVFFDRSLGNIQNGGGTGSSRAGPNALTSASDGNDFLAAHYDGGNLVDMVVQRTGGCTAESGECTHRFAYDWDEVGQMMRARRWDYAGTYTSSLPQYPKLPSTAPAVDLAMSYDASGQRVLKGVATPSSTLYGAQVFPSLRLDASELDGDDYTRNGTEQVYAAVAGMAFGRVIYDGAGQLPTKDKAKQHVLLEVVDHLGSTSIVVDNVTGGLVERSTYQAYGAADSDYRPAPWNFWERYRFTGAEADAELGLSYHVARYYSPQLGRWLSPDPLTVHGFASDPNAYAYVGGHVLRATDPLGLACEEADPVCSEDENGVACSTPAQICGPEGEQQTGDTPGVAGDSAPPPVAAGSDPSVSLGDSSTSDSSTPYSGPVLSQYGNIFDGVGGFSVSPQGFEGGYSSNNGSYGYAEYSNLYNNNYPACESCLLPAQVLVGGLAAKGLGAALGWAVDLVSTTSDGVGVGSTAAEGGATTAARTWESFLPQAEERVAQAYETYGGRSGVEAMARFTEDQSALVDLAKQAQRTGVTSQEADILRQWANETGLPFRGPEVHPGRPFGQFPHIHIGPIDHIPVN